MLAEVTIKLTNIHSYSFNNFVRLLYEFCKSLQQLFVIQGSNFLTNRLQADLNKYHLLSYNRAEI